LAFKFSCSFHVVHRGPLEASSVAAAAVSRQSMVCIDSRPKSGHTFRKV
jgi:hypothetical protein